MAKQSKRHMGQKVYSTEGVDSITVDSTGNVGIGTASPAAKLDVSGTMKGLLFITRNGAFAASHTVNSAPGEAWIVHVQNSPNTTITNLYYVRFDSAGGGASFNIGGTGGTQITTGTNQFTISPVAGQSQVSFAAIRIA